MFDAEQFIYHRRFLDAATTPANDVGGARGDGPRARAVGAAEAAEFALANVDRA